MIISGKKGFTLVEIMIVVAVISLLAAVALPNFRRAQRQAQANVCIANLKHIDDAKALWAIEEGAASSAVPVWEDLVPDYFNRAPECPAGGTYTLGAVDEYPACDVEGHELGE
ncbi:MAG: prepilin-type N-terminal cleavage/methylation domain-containing protein [Candidatus Omnitrophica bacterium]|jgi:prepilin-type N-terminal cleavage/methylation domain-containing protein|nr:prepilin-type N-terminal cleavage/methylation domain-containing protein [Candidatus Omnitrophota bacterium]